jgi:hypothetical protein
MRGKAGSGAPDHSGGSKTSARDAGKRLINLRDAIRASRTLWAS